MKLTIYRDRVEYTYGQLPPYQEVFSKADIEKDELSVIKYCIFRSIVGWMSDCLKTSNRESAEVAIWDRQNRDGTWTIQAKIIPEKEHDQV